MACRSDEYVYRPECLNRRVRKYMGADQEYKREEWNKEQPDLIVNPNERIDWSTRDPQELYILFLNGRDTARYRLMKTSLSTKLKNLFDDFAKVENISLRSYRFSYDGRPLFLSSVGKKTPSDLGMQDNANIIVTELTRVNKENDAPSKIPSTRSNTDKTGNKGKQKMGSQPRKHPPVIEKTAEELKIEHSKILGKLHEEAQPQLKLIRQRLNSLLIQRKPPKVKSSHRSNSEPRHPPTIYKSSSDDLCGKAGKSHYAVQVGEVANLYKTSKRRTSSHQQKFLKLDLHGFTKEEALDALNESLPQWNDIAMSGSYPFIIPVEIICGCGSQILSEVVEQWIKCTEQVANAPKSRKK